MRGRKAVSDEQAAFIGRRWRDNEEDSDASPVNRVADIHFDLEYDSVMVQSYDFEEYGWNPPVLPSNFKHSCWDWIGFDDFAECAEFVGEVSDEPPDEESEYERYRRERIAQNEAKLRELGFGSGNTRDPIGAIGGDSEPAPAPVPGPKGRGSKRKVSSPAPAPAPKAKKKGKSRGRGRN